MPSEYSQIALAISISWAPSGAKNMVLWKVWEILEGMDPSKGTFTVEEAGVYQLTFTGFITSRVSFWLVNRHLILTLIGQYTSGRAHGQCWYLSSEGQGGQNYRQSLREDSGGWHPGQRRWPPLDHQHRGAGGTPEGGPGAGLHGHTRQSWQLQAGLGLVKENHIYWAQNIKLNQLQYVPHVESSNLANKLWYLDVEIHLFKYNVVSSKWDLWHGGQYWPRNVTLHILSCQNVSCKPDVSSSGLFASLNNSQIKAWTVPPSLPSLSHCIMFDQCFEKLVKSQKLVSRFYYWLTTNL